MSDRDHDKKLAFVFKGEAEYDMEKRGLIESEMDDGD